MFCANCGKQLGPGTNFCPACGTKVGVDSGTVYEQDPVTGQPQPESAGNPPPHGAQGTWTTPTGAPTQGLIRPRSPRILGGVCAAFALHYGWDLNLVRIVTAVFALFYGIGVVAYIACWIIIPEAQYALPSQSR